MSEKECISTDRYFVYHLVSSLLKIIPFLYYTTLVVNATNSPFSTSLLYTDTNKLSTPVYWEWATVWGGSEDESKPYIRKGTDGSIFVIGETQGVNSILTTNGVHQQSHEGKSPIFISRFDSTGTLIYSTFVGTNERNLLVDVEVFENEVYVMYGINNRTAYKQQTLYHLDASGSRIIEAVNRAVVIEKIDTTGNLAWGTLIDGNSDETGFEIVVNAGGVWFYVDTYSTDLPVSKNAYQTNNAGLTDHFIGNLELNGSPRFATYFGGADEDQYNEFGVIALAANDESMVFAGYSEVFANYSGFPITGNPIDYPASPSPNTISKINIDGSLAYSIYYGQSEDVQPLRAIAMDENGNTFIAINELEGFMPTTIGAYQASYEAGSDTHLASLDDSGNLNWATYLGGSAMEDVDYIQYQNGHLFLVGTSTSADFPSTVGSFPHNADSFIDVFVAKFQTNGMPDYIHLFGGDDEDSPLAFDAENGCATLLINQEGEGFPVTSDPLSSFQGGHNIAMRLNADGSIAYSMPIECSDHLSDSRLVYNNSYNSVVGIGDKICYVSVGEDVSFPTTEGAYLNDNVNGFDLYVGCIGPIDCPDITYFDSPNVISPSTVMACKDGTIPGFTGTAINLINDSLALPAIYKRGQPLAETEGFVGLSYQWQAYNQITLQWEHVGGAITKDFLPPPTSGNVLYRRAAFTSNTACDTLFSNEVLVEVENSPFAPTLPADSIYQKCGTSTIMIDATATGGTGPYTYTWTPTTGLVGANMCSTFPNCPVVECSVTASTIYVVTVTDANGCIQTEQYTVNIYDPLVNAGPNVGACEGTGVQLGTPHIAPGTGDFTYNWTPNDGTLSCITCPQPIANPTTTTVYTLQVTGPDANGRCRTRGDSRLYGRYSATRGSFYCWAYLSLGTIKLH